MCPPLFSKLLDGGLGGGRFKCDAISIVISSVALGYMTRRLPPLGLSLRGRHCSRASEREVAGPLLMRWASRFRRLGFFSSPSPACEARRLLGDLVDEARTSSDSSRSARHVCSWAAWMPVVAIYRMARQR